MERQLGIAMRYWLAPLALSLAAPAAMADTITVDSLTDDGSGCTLRDAVGLANSGDGSGDGCMRETTSDDGVTIRFDVGGTITLADGELLIDVDGGLLGLGGPDDVIIDGDNQIVIDGGGMSRLFRVETAAAFANLTLQNGEVDGDNGAGILARADVEATNVSFLNNRALGEAGGPEADQGSGGGIFVTNDATFTMTGGLMEGNDAGRAGGGIESDADTLVVLNDVTFNENTTGPAPGNGAAFHITGAGDAEITGSTFTDNVAINEGGGVWNSAGTMTIEDSLFTGNIAEGDDAINGGGAVFNQSGGVDNENEPVGEVFITNSRIVGNHATGEAGSGGGIFVLNRGQLTVTDTVISGNTASRAGGGIEAVGGTMTTLIGVTLDDNFTGPNPGNGGGVHITGDGDIEIRDSVVRNNTATTEGGGLWNGTGTMDVVGVSIIGNVAEGDEVVNGGGGVFNQAGGVDSGTGTVNIRRSRIVDNHATGTAGSGGGIFNLNGGTLNVEDTEIAANTANRAGGGIETVADTIVELTRVTLGGSSEELGNDTGMNPGNGGGFHTTGAGDVTIRDSSVGFNVAQEGGGLWNSGVGTMTVINTTVSNNMANGEKADDGDNVGTGGGGGGGVFQQPPMGELTLDFVTIAENTTASDGGGLSIPSDDSDVTVSNSVITDNSASLEGNDVFGDFAGDDNIIGADAGLGAYRLFGGLTATHPLLMDSPAINAGMNCPPPAEDQRTFERALGGSCDIGAFELTDDVVLEVTGDNPASITLGPDDDNVTVLSLSVSNTGADTVTVDALDSVFRINAPLSLLNFDLEDDITVFLGMNGSAPASQGSATVTFDAGVLTVSDLNVQLAEDESFQLLLVVRSDGNAPAMGWLTTELPLYAGGGLLALLLLVRTSLARRYQVAALMLAAALILTGCFGSSSSSSRDRDRMVMDDNTIQLSALTLTGAPSNSVADFLIGDGLPVDGPEITLTD